MGGEVTALVDRLFVVKQYRRRRVARTTMLNALVDVLEAGVKPGWGGLAAPPAIAYVSAVIPQEARLKPFYDMLVGMGFQPRRQFATDPTGQWEDPAKPADVPRTFVEVSLPAAALMPLLQKAQADKEGMRPRAEP